MPRRRSPVAELLAAAAAAFERLGVSWYLFGAQAALVYGAARLTADVDVTVDLGTRSWRELVDALGRAGFELRIPDAESFVERTRVLPLVHVASAMPLDVVLAGSGLEAAFLRRAHREELAGVRVSVASPEDMVTMKLLAGRPKDTDDALAILAAQPRLDLKLVRETLREIESALDRHDLLPTLAALVERARSRS